MKIISHRGNLTGKNPELENNPTYIRQALALGFEVEVDLWVIDDQLFLGHDSPQYRIDRSFLFNQNLWVHCKNPDAVSFCKKTDLIRWFWHENDRMTLTSKGDLWCFPGIFLPEGITVMNSYTDDVPIIRGICTDHASLYTDRCSS